MKKKIAIVGGGSSSLLLACLLNSSKFDIHLYEGNSAIGRKFLVAGQGGLNITHSEDPESFLKKYTPHEFLKPAFLSFTNKDLIEWLNQTNIETFVGSSGRVFPIKNLKPVEVLNVFLDKMEKNRVVFHFRHQFKGFANNDELLFSYEGNEIKVKTDLTLFCLGGASWPVTGSKGEWINFFTHKNIKVNPFQASNCSLQIKWPETVKEKIEGKVLKNIAFSCGMKNQIGEAVITKSGLEGSGIYPLSPQIREQLLEKGSAELFLDLKPGWSIEKIKDKILIAQEKSNFTENIKRDLNIPSFQIQLLKSIVPKADFEKSDLLSHHIKHLKLKVHALGPIEDAISTTGGIDLSEIDESFMLKKLPGHYVIGEMLDYDAPTGGYLLQSCFSMANFVASYLNKL